MQWEDMILIISVEMELKKLHMGTMSYGFDSMDEVALQLATAFGASAAQCMSTNLWA
jgi:phospholipid-translocating ATPase